jgi:hypothetical protein
MVILALSLGAGAAQAASAEKSDAPPPEYEYIELKPLTLPIITDKGLTQQVSLMVSLELPYGKLEEVKFLMPRLADAYLRDLYGVLGVGGAMMKGGLIDVVAVKQRLAAVTVSIAGEGKVNDVLLQVVQQRPM